VHSSPELWIEQSWIQRHVATNLRILFGGDNLAVNHKDHFRRHPATAKFLVLVELGLLSLRPILTSWTKHSDEVKILLIDPELRRMQVIRFGAYNIDGSSLPRVFSKLLQIKLQSLQFRGDLAGKRAIDVKSQNQKWMFERSRGIDLAVFEYENLAVGK